MRIWLIKSKWRCFSCPVTWSNYHVTSSEYHMTSSEYHVTSSNYHVTSSNYHVTSSDGPLTSSNYHVTSSNYHVTSWRDKVTCKVLYCQVTLPGVPHPSIKRSVNIISRYFEELMIDSQDFLGSPEKCQKVRQKQYWCSMSAIFLNLPQK